MIGWKQRNHGIRRGLLALTSLLALAWLITGCAAEDVAARDAGHEIWAVDQGTNIVYIYDDQHQLADQIDLHALGVRTAHMISFSSDYRYAVIASTGSGDVTVIRTEDREVVETIPTGPRTHMASFTPDDSAIVVDVIGSADEPWNGAVVEIEADLDTETFSVGRSLVIAEDPLFAANADRFTDSGPICHEYGPDGTHAFITLGPGLANGGLVVLNTDTWSLDHVAGVQELPVNCGTVTNEDRSRMILTAGSGEVGEYYVIDTRTFEVVAQGDTRGQDAHGVWLTHDGSEFWIVNRVSDDGVILDADTFEVVDSFHDVGGTPDLMVASPNGEHFYVSLRGPNPKSAAHVAFGETPGFSVLNVADRSLVDVIQPDGDNPDSDFHGIGVRVLN